MFQKKMAPKNFLSVLNVLFLMLVLIFFKGQETFFFCWRINLETMLQGRKRPCLLLRFRRKRGKIPPFFFHLVLALLSEYMCFFSRAPPNEATMFLTQGHWTFRTKTECCFSLLVYFCFDRDPTVGMSTEKKTIKVLSRRFSFCLFCQPCFLSIYTCFCPLKSKTFKSG